MANSMPELEVPDKTQEWPPDVAKHSDDMDTFLDGQFFTQIRDCWDAVGNGEKVSKPESSFKSVLNPPDDLGSSSETSAQLSLHIGKLQRAVDELRKAENDVIPLLDKANNIRATSQDAMTSLISSLSEDAREKPTNMSEDMHILQYATEGMKGSATVIEGAKKNSDEARGPHEEKNSELADLKNQIKKLKDQLAGKGDPDLEDRPFQEPPPGPELPPDRRDWDEPPDPDDVDDPDDPKDFDPEKDPELDSPSTGDDPSRIGDDTLPDGTDQTQDPTGMGQTGMGAGGMGGMGGMLGPMMQMMQQQAMQRQMADQDLNKKGPAVDPQRPGPAPAPAPKPAPAPAHSAAPAGNQPANAAPPPGANSGQPAGAPPQQPGPDGGMEFTFEDGRTVKVSEPVYRALEGATGNAEGTDAQAAYEQTPVKWSDPKEIGAGVDPFDLMTGDVAVWEDRTAIVVVFGSQGGGPEQGNAGQGNPGDGALELVVDGRLQEFDGSKADEMSDNSGEFGSFVGFKHPQGIELKGSQESQAAAGAPGSEGEDPSGMANMPAAPA